jgi:hypothetical protein
MLTRFILINNIMKHTIFVEKKKEKIQLEHIVLSMIRIKPKFYCIQVKKNLRRK